MAVKIAKTADRKKEMDTTKSTDCPKCGKPTRIVKRVKDRERGSSGRDFYFVLGLRVLREALDLRVESFVSSRSRSESPRAEWSDLALRARHSKFRSYSSTRSESPRGHTVPAPAELQGPLRLRLASQHFGRD